MQEVIKNENDEKKVSKLFHKHRVKKKLEKAKENIFGFHEDKLRKITKVKIPKQQSCCRGKSQNVMPPNPHKEKLLMQALEKDILFKDKLKELLYLRYKTDNVLLQ